MTYEGHVSHLTATVAELNGAKVLQSTNIQGGPQLMQTATIRFNAENALEAAFGLLRTGLAAGILSADEVKVKLSGLPIEVGSQK